MKVFGALIGVAMLVLVLTTGCGQDNQEERGTETTGDSATTSEGQARQETTSEEKRAGEGTREAGAPFTAVPEMSGGAEGVADDILGVRFERSEGYERAIIDFGLGGAPASRVPAWSLSSPTGEGYARITFPDVEATSVSDGSL